MAQVGQGKHRLDVEPPNRDLTDSVLPATNDDGELKTAQHRRGAQAVLRVVAAER